MLFLFVRRLPFCDTAVAARQLGGGAAAATEGVLLCKLSCQLLVAPGGHHVIATSCCLLSAIASQAAGGVKISGRMRQRAGGRDSMDEQQGERAAGWDCQGGPTNPPTHLPTCQPAHPQAYPPTCLSTNTSRSTLAEAEAGQASSVAE